MSEVYEVEYHPMVIHDDIPSLGTSEKKAIQKAIERKLTVFPQHFGLPLKHSLQGCWKLRVGDYRVIYVIEKAKVIVIRIGHRKEVYKKRLPRL